MTWLTPLLEFAARARGRIGWWPALSVMALLGLGALTILLLVFHTSRSQDELAQQSERALAQTLLAQQSNHLAKLAFDYSFWNEAYQNVTIEPDPGWMKYQAEYLRDTWHAGFVAFLDESNRHAATVGGNRMKPARNAEHLRGDDFYRVIAATRRAPLDAAEAQSGVVLIGQRFFLIAASAITPEQPDIWPGNRRIQERNILLIGIPLTPARLTEIFEPYGLHDPLVTPIADGRQQGIGSLDLQERPAAGLSHLARQQSRRGDRPPRAAGGGRRLRHHGVPGVSDPAPSGAAAAGP